VALFRVSTGFPEVFADFLARTARKMKIAFLPKVLASPILAESSAAGLSPRFLPQQHTERRNGEITAFSIQQSSPPDNLAANFVYTALQHSATFFFLLLHVNISPGWDITAVVLRHSQLTCIVRVCTSVLAPGASLSRYRYRPAVVLRILNVYVQLTR
jgi:hypothetical protein